MPIFTKVESKSLSGRLFHTATFIFLTLGGITMIYPFILMISGAFRSEVDETDLDLVPAYFMQEEALYQKFLEYKYQQNVSAYNIAHLERQFAFYFVDAPLITSEAAGADLRRFIEEGDLPIHWQVLAGVAASRTTPENLRELRTRLKNKYNDDIERFSRDVGTAISRWDHVSYVSPDWLAGGFDFEDNPQNEVYLELMLEAPAAERQLVSLSGYFLEVVGYPRYGALEEINKNFGLSLSSLKEFRLPSKVPGEDLPIFRKEWINFVLEDLNVSFVDVDGVSDADYQTYLREYYNEGIEHLNLVWETEYKDYSEILLPRGALIPGAIRRDYNDFLRTIPPEHWRLTGPEYAWWKWLEKAYGNEAAVSKAHGREYRDWKAVWLPVADLEMLHTLENKWSLRWTYASRNFINVLNAIFVEGRVFVNTLIYCSLAVLFAILINPLAAYALSRFQLPGTYKILLIMMAVMAFPPMVTTIPVFLMMQNLNLTNTFAGLLLPTIANGYLIYLLKGFFDSLPRELYEAAQIEGASEFRMFSSISMALSKPILAVVALSAFNAAYTTFLFALIIAPEEDMWLLSVWLYQYRETVSTGGVFASVLVASIPPILVFLFAQNVILRGIVVPVEK